MKDTYIGSVKLESDNTRICVPVTGKNEDEIIKEISFIEENFKTEADIIEYRADYFEDIFNEAAVESLFENIKCVSKNIPLLFTFRTAIEGGEKDIDKEEYKRLIIKAIESGVFSAVDVEIERDKEMISEIKRYAEERKVTVIASYHDFKKTPDELFILGKLTEMERQGADVAKIALMPEDDKDVLNLINASFMAKNILSIPIITISMGMLGAVSRLTGKLTGSVMTFGIADNASAPGQIAAKELKNAMKLFG